MSQYNPEDPKFTSRSSSATSVAGSQKSRKNARTQRDQMLQVFFSAVDPLTDMEAARRAGLFDSTPFLSCWSSRGNELRKMGLIERVLHDNGKPVTRVSVDTGAPCQVSVITDKGKSWITSHPVLPAVRS